MKIILVAGARPNFMKIAPIIESIKNFNRMKHELPRTIDYLLVHTGQHYNDDMSKFFFVDLIIPQPDIYLGVGSGTHAEQTGKVMIAFERVCFEEKPDLVVVVGDVNSTIACALVAAKLCVPVAHVEAGLRSFDRTMPEEINRILTDQISDFLFTTCEDANQNLINEGISKEKIFFVGNVMIDTLLSHIEKAKESNILERLKIKDNTIKKKYALLTLHRPSNVDDPMILKKILDVLHDLLEKIPIIFPVHPRTLKQIKKFKLDKMINFVESISSFKANGLNKNILAIPPVGYLDFLCLMSRATMVLTDSGGIQEETTILGIPCLTLRTNTERPITVTEGTNIVVGNNPDKIKETALSVLKSGIFKGNMPKYWDGKAAARIVKILESKI